MFQSSSESIVIVLICSFSFFKDATVICMQVPYKNLPIDTYTGPLKMVEDLGVAPSSSESESEVQRIYQSSWYH